jgi:hypothetical protein
MIIARDMGVEARNVSNSAEEADVDLVLAIGSVFLYPDLVARPKTARRVLWHTEPLLRKSTASEDGIHPWLPTGRLLDISRALVPRLANTKRWRLWREKAASVREPRRNLVQLRRHAKAFDRIVIDANCRAQGALEAGIPIEVVPFGYHASYAGPIGSNRPRDIDVMAMGNADPIARRHRVLVPIEAELAESNVNVVRVSGHTYGTQRRAMLERARVSLDVHRIPGNEPNHNFVLVTAAGAALVTEPVLQPGPLVPGVHYVEAEPSGLAQATRDLLADEPRRLRMVEAAQELLRTELDLRRNLLRALG